MSKNQVTGEPIKIQADGLFADRENLKEAFDYAYQVIESSMESDTKIYGYTAISVIFNTLANKYHLIKK